MWVAPGAAHIGDMARKDESEVAVHSEIEDLRSRIEEKAIDDCYPLSSILYPRSSASPPDRSARSGDRRIRHPVARLATGADGLAAGWVRRVFGACARA